MFNIGFSEMLVICAIALIVIGPKQLPEVARMLGRLINDLKRTTSDVSKVFSDPDFYEDFKQNPVLKNIEEEINKPIEEDKKEPVITNKAEETPPRLEKDKVDKKPS